MAEFVNVELGGINDHVGEFTDGLHELALVDKAFAYRKMLAKRMGTPRFAVAAQQGVFAGVDEHERDGMLAAQMFEQGREFRELRAFASVHEQGRAREIGFTGGVQLRKNGNELDGEVVDTVEAHIFKGAKNGAFSGAGKTGEDDELT